MSYLDLLLNLHQNRTIMETCFMNFVSKTAEEYWQKCYRT
jgi:hypothetical protein